MYLSSGTLIALLIIAFLVGLFSPLIAILYFVWNADV